MAAYRSQTGRWDNVPQTAALEHCRLSSLPAHRSPVRAFTSTGVRCQRFACMFSINLLTVVINEVFPIEEVDLCERY